MSAVDQQFVDSLDLNQGVPTDPAVWSAIIDAVREYAGDDSVVYFKSSQLDIDIAQDVTGRCLCRLVECDDAPLDIEVWSGDQPPRTYCVTQEGDADE